MEVVSGVALASWEEAVAFLPVRADLSLGDQPGAMGAA